MNTSGNGRPSVDIARPPRDPSIDHIHPCRACDVRQFSVCNVLDAPDLQRLAEVVTTITLPAHRAVFHEGDPAEHLYNVTSGCVKLYKLLADGRRQVTGFLFAGDFLGLALEDDYAYSAETVSEATLCRFPRRRLERLLEDLPKLEKRLLGNASNELAAAQDQMILLGRKSAREKIASFLVNLAGRAERRGQPSDPLPLPMSRTDIADYLGLTTETVSRTFTQLKTQRVITLLPGGMVALTDRLAIERLASGG
ncbi:Crp/Fnr family transcriptional regulator [Stella sp.]|uniref:Crp/Fnr family transcriptional regulator n=1 Tax=Stella sp. TaxID=2912054 RepID=UPI0035B39C34